MPSPANAAILLVPLTSVPFTCCPSPQIGAVVVGWDRNINYYKMQYGLTCLLENEDCLFIATNTDVSRGSELYSLPLCIPYAVHVSL